MPVTMTRTKTDLIGTPASPATITAGSNTSGTVDMTTPSGVTSGVVMVAVVTSSSAPTSAITVVCSVTLDAGAHYTADPTGTFAISTPAASTTYTFRYDPPDACDGVTVKVTNGATNSITAYAEAKTLAVS